MNKVVHLTMACLTLFVNILGNDFQSKIGIFFEKNEISQENIQSVKTTIPRTGVIGIKIEQKENRFTNLFQIGYQYTPDLRFQVEYEAELQPRSGIAQLGSGAEREYEAEQHLALAFESPYVSWGKLPTQGVLGTLLDGHRFSSIQSRDKFQPGVPGKGLGVVLSFPIGEKPVTQQEGVQERLYEEGGFTSGEIADRYGRITAGVDISTQGERYIGSGEFWRGSWVVAVLLFSRYNRESDTPGDWNSSESFGATMGGSGLIAFRSNHYQITLRQYLFATTAATSIGSLSRVDYRYHREQLKIESSFLVERQRLGTTLKGAAEVVLPERWGLSSQFQTAIGGEGSWKLQVAGWGQCSFLDGSHRFLGEARVRFESRNHWLSHGTYTLSGSYRYKGPSGSGVEGALHYTRKFLEYENSLKCILGFRVKEDRFDLQTNCEIPLYGSKLGEPRGSVENQGQGLEGELVRFLLSSKAFYRWESGFVGCSINSKLHISLEFSLKF